MKVNKKTLTWIWNNDLLNDKGKDVFEYSVFGSPQQKIGNFTGQKKLGDFSCN